MSGDYKVYELRDSESGSIDQSSLEAAEVWSITKRYVVGQCPGGFYEAREAIADYAPRYVRNPFGRYWRRKKLGLKGLGKAVFEVTAEYETLQPITDEDQGDEPESSFTPGSIAWDTTGATEHRTQAKSERVVPAGAVDFKGAINVSGTSVQGIDVVVPTMRYTETWIMPLAIGLSTDYVANVFSTTGKLNKSKFRAFAPGECLFMGARAQWSGDQPYVPVTFEFQARPHNNNYRLGGGLESTTKKGWEYVWIKYEPDQNNSTLIQKPVAYIFDTLYDEAEFSLLKIAGREPGRRVTGQQATAAASAGAGGFTR
jgi:hypothetical protein